MRGQIAGHPLQEVEHLINGSRDQEETGIK
jgi:hypothetical protein